MTGITALTGSGATGGVDDLSNMSIEAAMMDVQMQRAGLLEGQLRDQIKDIQARNTEIQELTKWMNAVKDTTPESDGSVIIDPNKVKVGDLPDDLKDLVTQDGDRFTISKDNLSSVEDKLKNDIDSANSTQQLQMVALQDLTNKYNQSIDLMSNFTSKMSKLTDDIIGNMR